MPFRQNSFLFKGITECSKFVFGDVGTIRDMSRLINDRRRVGLGFDDDLVDFEENIIFFCQAFRRVGGDILKIVILYCIVTKHIISDFTSYY